MKAITLGTAVLALALAGCGGSTSYTIGGTISGLSNTGLELQNGNDVIAVPVGATSYRFPTQVGYGDAYNIVIKSQPLHMTCAVNSYLGLSGTAGRTETIDVPLVCTQNSYAVATASITGLTADGLVIINGANGQVSVAKNPTAAITLFSGIPVGVSYGLTVLQQPTGLTCTIANGTGVMGDANRADVVIACVPNT